MLWEVCPTFTELQRKKSTQSDPCYLTWRQHSKEMTCCTEGDWLVAKGLEQTLPLHASHPSMICSEWLHIPLHQQNRATEWQYWTLLQQWPTANRDNERRRAKAIPCFRVSRNKEGRYQLYFFHDGSCHENHTSTGQETPAAEPSSTLPLTAQENISDNFTTKADRMWRITSLYSLQDVLRRCPQGRGVGNTMQI